MSSWPDARARIASPSLTRVDRLTLPLAQERLDLDRVLSALSSAPASSVFIVLLDMQYYACTRCSRAASPLVTAYAGHYILVHGYDKETREILFNDPSADSRASKVEWDCVCPTLTRETHLTHISHPLPSSHPSHAQPAARWA
jgi:hypothetical protein